MDTLILALDTFVLSLSAGISVFVVSSLTSESELFFGLRRWLVKRAEAHTPTSWFDDNDHTSRLAFTLIDKFNWFLADVIQCPFCSSWWHGLWIVAMYSLAMGHAVLGFLIYLPSIGICSVLSRLTHAKAVSKAEVYGNATAEEVSLEEQYRKMQQHMESRESDV